MTDHTVGGQTFSVGKLTVRQQAEIATRLGAMAFALEREVADDHVEGARFIASIVTGEWASVAPADRAFIESVCCAAVRVYRGEPARLHPAFNAQSGEPMFADVGIDLGVMLELVDLVIQENLGPFFEKFREDRRRRVESLNDSPEPTDPGTSP